MFTEDLSYDKLFTENLLDKYAKIIGIYTNEIELFKAINENIDLTLKQDLSLSFYNQHQKSTRELSKESALFLWFQLFKDVLLHLPQNDKNAKQQLVNYLKQCYHNNNKQLKLIDEFDSLYKAEDAIKWYTGQPFLYKNLNKALRTEDIEQLYLFRFFITDLCTVLHEEYTYLKEFEPCITLYRGASMSNDELEKLRQNVGQLISTNGFLSTSQIKEVALAFASSGKSPKKHRVLFEIKCDLALTETTVLAPVSQYSLIPDEQEVLFDTGAVFEIISITTDEKNEDTTRNEESTLSIISMKATDEGSQIAKDYINANLMLLNGRSSQVMFGILLADMGLYDQSIKYFERLVADRDLLTHLPDDVIARAYNEIGNALDIQGKYRQALEFYLRAYDMTFNEDKLNDENLLNAATPIANIAYVFKNLGYFEKSLKFFLQALEIVDAYCGDTHHQTAAILDNIGSVYRDIGDMISCLEYFQKAYEIYTKVLPENHLDIARVLNNIGVAYMNLGKLDLAMNFLRQGLNMRLKLLPTEHLDIAISLMNIGGVLHNRYYIQDSLDHYKQAYTILEKLFPNGHRCVAHCLQEMGYVYKRIESYHTAMECFENALRIRQNLLPDNHPEILQTHMIIDDLVSLILYPRNKCCLK
ncbi:unnamed protein product [Adineta ricciae]|uniref:NAD(P)(+)--arginine ADP-ribosyltransferase n=1 Tax=Adineta ricciae TaxID=249248 RepID=A0A815GXI6_ADIRI|nr:unnamed protein product [Adineta ricciae]